MKNSPQFVHTSGGYLNINVIEQFKMGNNGSLEIMYKEGKDTISVYIHDNAEQVFQILKRMSIN